ncbi:ArdC family protein [Arcanobacterium haemolyticum]
MSMVTRDEYAQRVAQTFIDQIEKGAAPWRKKWEPGELQLPMNLASGQPYHGFNSIWLAMANRTDPRWMTYKQAQAAGGQVRKGEQGRQIIYFSDRAMRIKRDKNGNPIKDENGKTVKEIFKTDFPVFKVYTVFNGEQVDGIKPWIPKTITVDQLWDNHNNADQLLENSGAKIKYVSGGDNNFYSSATDEITLVSKAQFPSMIDYYSVAFHELSHWTGHPERLNRNLQNKFGSAAYAREELRAELGQFMVCQELGLGYEPYQLAETGAYLASWTQILQDAPQELLAAAADAQKIQNYLMEYAPEREREITKSHALPSTPREDDVKRKTSNQTRSDLVNRIQAKAQEKKLTPPTAIPKQTSKVPKL